MCQRAKVVLNRYSGRPFLQKCGVCPSCLQERAQTLKTRIETELSAMSDDAYSLFCTLTYKNGCAPYVYDTELFTYKRKYRSLTSYEKTDYLRLHRQLNEDDYKHKFEIKRDYKLVRCRTSRGTFITRLISGLNNEAVICKKLQSSNFAVLKPLKYTKHKIGVIYYKDWQNFMKRLRQYLKNYYGYDTKNEIFKAFNCAEYGPNTVRPHFHQVFILDKKLAKYKFVRCVLKAWPFADSNRTAKFIQEPVDVAGYVAEYVNSFTYVPQVLRNNFKQQRSASLGFGLPLLNNKASLFKRLTDCDFREASTKSFSEQPYTNILSRRYINYFFPLFPGYNYTSPSGGLQTAFSLFHGFGKKDYVQCVRRSYRRVSEQLNSELDKPIRFIDWWLLYDRVNYKYNQAKLKEWYENFDALYINARDDVSLYQKSPEYVSHDNYLKEKFFRKTKIRKVNDSVDNVSL